MKSQDKRATDSDNTRLGIDSYVYDISSVQQDGHIGEHTEVASSDDPIHHRPKHTSFPQIEHECRIIEPLPSDDMLTDVSENDSRDDVSQAAPVRLAVVSRNRSILRNAQSPTNHHSVVYDTTVLGRDPQYFSHDMECRKRHLNVGQSPKEQLVLGFYFILIVLIGFAFALTSAIKNGTDSFSSAYSMVFLMIVYTVAIICCFILMGLIWRANRQQANERAEASNSTTSAFDNGAYSGDSPRSIKSVDSTVAKQRRGSCEACNVKYTIAYYYGKEGISLYMRLGALVFAVASMIFNIIGILAPWEIGVAEECKKSPDFKRSAISMIELIYFWLQTYFIFKYHKVVFLKSQTVIRFCLIHLCVSNLIQWIFMIVDEALELFHFVIIHDKVTPDIDPIVYSLAQSDGNCSDADSKLAKIRVYLFPFIIEYSLIGASVMYTLYRKIGVLASHTNAKKNSNIHPHDRSHKVSCQKSRNGLFVGLFIGATYSIFFATRFMYGNEYSTLITNGYYIEWSFLMTLLIVAFVMSSGMYMYITRHFYYYNKHKESLMLDIRLIYVTTIGLLLHTIFSFLPPMSYIISGKSENRTQAILTLVLYFSSFSQVIAQSSLLCDGLWRRARKPAQQKEKPGRNVLILLIVLNFLFWIENSFRFKYNEMSRMNEEYFGKLPMCLIVSFSLPMIIFYRFHSSVVLAELWEKLYELKTWHSVFRKRRESFC